MKSRIFSVDFLTILVLCLCAAGLTRQNHNFVKADKKEEKITLKEIYKDYFPIGAAVGYKDLVVKKNVSRFIQEQYNSITPENEMKPKRLQPNENTFSWSEADKMVEFALNNNMKIRGHTLVWPLMTPKWMYYDGDKLATKELLLKRIKNHIYQVVKRYKGKTYCWDVVNECVANIGEKTTFRKVDSLYRIAGEEYVGKAFQYAHEADPSAKLFYNDTGFDLPVKRDRIYHFLKRLKDKGVPIHGVGMQTHLGIDGIPEKMFRENIDLFSSLGLEVQVTELDVSIYKARAKADEVKMLGDDYYTQEVQHKQMEIYDMIFRVCREKKDKVTGITLWSAYDWDNFLFRKFKKKNYPYLFDDKLQPKKTFYKVTSF